MFFYENLNHERWVETIAHTILRIQTARLLRRTYNECQTVERKTAASMLMRSQCFANELDVRKKNVFKKLILKKTSP